MKRSSPDARELRDRVDDALRRGKLDEALAALEELEFAEPDIPRWPHRKGDLLRRKGHLERAVSAYELAVRLYAQAGFIARAVAMAKTILSIDPTRTDVLASVDPEAARKLLPRRKSISIQPPPRASAAPPPVPGELQVSDFFAEVPTEKHEREPIPAPGIEVVVGPPSAPPPPPPPAPAVIARRAPKKVQPDDEVAAFMAQLEARVGRPPASPPPSALSTGGTPVPTSWAAPGASHDTDFMAGPPPSFASEITGEFPALLPLRATLSRAPDATEDETRFSDLDNVEIEVDLSEMEIDARARPSAPVTAAETPSDADELRSSAERLTMLPSFPLFSELSKDALHELATGADLVELPDGAAVISSGEPADALFAIVEGSVRCTVPDVEGDQPVYLGEGDVFGESCLLEGERRRADVVAVGGMTALRIPGEVLAGVVAGHPEVGEILFELLTRRLVTNILLTSPLFTPFDLSTRRELSRLFEIRRAPRGTMILEEGRKSDALYVLLAGRVDIGARGAQSITGLPGAIFGQDTLLSNAPSRITVKAAIESAVLRLPGARFSAVACQYPPILAHLAELSYDLEPIG